MPSEFSLWQVLVLAVVQGITEFLPISSDGHLVLIAPLLFGSNAQPPEMLDLTIVLHLGTLGSILVFYRQRIARLCPARRRKCGQLWAVLAHRGAVAGARAAHPRHHVLGGPGRGGGGAHRRVGA
jgi:undecaprenyl pyrophosphate phosphatase UppP